MHVARSHSLVIFNFLCGLVFLVRLNFMCFFSLIWWTAIGYRSEKCVWFRFYTACLNLPQSILIIIIIISIKINVILWIIFHWNSNSILGICIFFGCLSKKPKLLCIWFENKICTRSFAFQIMFILRMLLFDEIHSLINTQNHAMDWR